MKEVYEEIMATRNLAKVRNYRKAIAYRPEDLASTWNNMKTVMAEGSLARRPRQQG